MLTDRSVNFPTFHRYLEFFRGPRAVPMLSRDRLEFGFQTVALRVVLTYRDSTDELFFTCDRILFFQRVI